MSTDRDGTPTERVWRLPAIRWPGLVIWDHVNAGRGGRYEVFYRALGVADTYQTTGIRFATLAKVTAHLFSLPLP